MFAQCSGIWVTITTHYIHLPTADSMKQILAVLRQSAMTHSQTNIWQRTFGFHTTLWVTLTPSQLFSVLTAALFECLISPPSSGCPVAQRGEAGQHLRMAKGISVKCQEGLFLHVLVLLSHHGSTWAQFWLEQESLMARDGQGATPTSPSQVAQGLCLASYTS